MTFTIIVRADSSRTRRAFNSLDRQLQPTVLKAIGDDTVKWIGANFRQRGLEGRWAPLTPTTIKMRRRRGIYRYGLTTPLRETGALSKSIKYRVNRASVTVRAEAPYAALHQSGGTVKLGGAIRYVPARPIFPSPERARKLAVRAANRAIKQIIQSAGLT